MAVSAGARGGSTAGTATSAVLTFVCSTRALVRGGCEHDRVLHRGQPRPRAASWRGGANLHSGFVRAPRQRRIA